MDQSNWCVPHPVSLDIELIDECIVWELVFICTFLTGGYRRGAGEEERHQLVCVFVFLLCIYLFIYLHTYIFTQIYTTFINLETIDFLIYTVCSMYTLSIYLLYMCIY